MVKLLTTKQCVGAGKFMCRKIKGGARNKVFHQLTCLMCILERVVFCNAEEMSEDQSLQYSYLERCQEKLPKAV